MISRIVDLGLCTSFLFIQEYYSDVVVVVVGSYLPWFDVFFKLLNYLSDLLKNIDESELSDVKSLLEHLMSADVSKPLEHVDVTLPATGLVGLFCAKLRLLVIVVVVVVVVVVIVIVVVLVV